ncbi:hypothetical protein HK100_010634 [Physocladia obscura]|uniref:NADH:flavin oxidoreductase/NADH oxidase N-terminal domain-containing protein n=1 Tax=Physocladia obscura TaxID=109957 RepID=A0AAD5T336_9FUNG|nr:hypothetical protein HK100_010634 [Physocladia obscura]
MAATPKTLFTPVQVGNLHLPNRIFLAPLTRSRAGPTHVPNALMAEYYAQRASGGLLIAEATQIRPNASAFYGEPGIYTAEQIAGWKHVTDAVHAKGGRIFLQIWHGGRAVHPALNGGDTTEVVSTAAVAIDTSIHTPLGKLPNAVPRALDASELPAYVASYADAATSALKAGFDGVEVHAANGYLIDQFLRDGTNTRTDDPKYGNASLSTRSQLLNDVLAAVIAAVGTPEKVGVRFSPLNSYNDMHDSDPAALSEHVAKLAQHYNLAYVHVMRSSFSPVTSQVDIVPIFRKNFKNILIANMGYSKDEANKAIADGAVDAVAFGTQFLANPDLPERFLKNATLNSPDPSTFYGGAEKGYTDYPTLA